MIFQSRLLSLSPSTIRTILAVLITAFGFASIGRAVDLNSQEQAIFNSLKNASGQHRPFVVLDPILCQVARQKAADMAARDYYDHVNPDGHGPNWLVRQAGYVLPDYYDQSPAANNIESVNAGRASAGDAWSSWMDSAPHKSHLLGENSFFAAQTSVGVGFVNRPGSRWTYYWVVLSAPPQGPSVAIKSPRSGQEVTESTITVEGTSSGKPAAAKVQIALENATGTTEWADATGTMTWSATINNLLPGLNTIHVRSLDASDAVLDETSRNIRYVVLAPLHVEVAGQGTVTRGFIGETSREVGRNYTITAKPTAGWLFSGWTGSVTSSAATISFTMAEGFSLTANFIPNPFAEGRGSYTGFAISSNGSPALLTLNLAPSGTFSGKLRAGDLLVPLRGAFDAAGHAQFSTTLNGQTINVDLTYSKVDGVTQINGTIAGSDWSVAISTELQGKPADASMIGRYTVVLRADPNAPVDAPKGDGFATASVSSSGQATVRGVLADGTPFAAGSRLTRSGTMPVFLAPYKHRGQFAGSLQFHDSTGSDVEGQLQWTRPAQQNAVSFPSGFTTWTTAVGGKYTAPARGVPIVQVPALDENTELELGDGGLSPTVQPATLTPENVVIVSSPTLPDLSVKVTAANGQFRGSFTHPLTGTTTAFRGVIVQKQNAGFGFFLANGESGYATLAPSASALAAAQP